MSKRSRNRVLGATAAAVAAVACARTPVTPLYDPDGGKAYRVECFDEFYRGDGTIKCLRKADELCPEGYETLLAKTDRFAHSLTIRCHSRPEAVKPGSTPPDVTP